MKVNSKFSASWIPHTVAFSLQAYFTHIGTGEVVVDGSVPREFKVADIVAADTISAPEEGNHLSESHRTALITGSLPLEDLTVPPLRLKLEVPDDAVADYASAEAVFFKSLGIDANVTDPDPVLLLLMRLFSWTKDHCIFLRCSQGPPACPLRRRQCCRRDPRALWRVSSILVISFICPSLAKLNPHLAPPPAFLRSKCLRPAPCSCRSKAPSLSLQVAFLWSRCFARQC